MVHNDILIITLMLYYKLVSTRDAGSSSISVQPCKSFVLRHKAGQEGRGEILLENSFMR